MQNIIYNNQSFVCKEQENLLDAFFRNKIDVPFSCRNGTCQACLIQVVSGHVPSMAQVGLSSHLKNSKHILPCRCYPSTDMKLKSSSFEDVYTICNITKLKLLASSVMAVTIKPQTQLSYYKTGQFINIITRLDNRIRSYSLTSSYIRNQEDITIHVQKNYNGLFSNWIFDEAKKGDELNIHYPLGACFNSENTSVLGKLFISSGSGLGSELAIIKETLAAGYTGIVHLHRFFKDESEIYLTDVLNHLSSKYSNFRFFTYVNKHKSNNKRIKFGSVNQLVFKHYKKFIKWEVYLYGNPDMVKSSTRNALAINCSAQNIFSDAFEYGEKFIQEVDKMEFIEEEKRKFYPDEKMWKALNYGTKLRQILNDFYDKVLSDSLLSHFFKGVTKEHIIGKQFAFFNQIYTGKDCYFGDRPRNAHHWMIISDSLFDYREKLFADSCIKYGLKEPFLNKILELNESYRDVIVKTKVWPRITNGEIVPIKGFEEMILEVGSICDGCKKSLESGYKVHYHDRTGKMYCIECKKL